MGVINHLLTGMMLQEVVVSHIFYFHPETWGFTIYNLTNMFQIGWFNHQLEQPIPLLRPAAISTWYPKQPVFNGRLMISNRFFMYDLVHHPIETTANTKPLFLGGKGINGGLPGVPKVWRRMAEFQR